MYKGIKNIGIFAHVDAGKTTLTEQLLFKSGTIRSLGSVDDGNTVTDALSLERERGISIQSTPVSYDYKDYKINILDTPGHVDFVAEVERSMMALDGAILVISAKEGVQSHTRLLYQTLKKRNVPMMLVVNKVDRLGVDIQGLMKQINEEIDERIFYINFPCNVGNKEVTLIKRSFNKEDTQFEHIIEHVDELLLSYLDNEHITEETIKKVLLNEVNLANWYPVCFASAMHGIGIEEILDTMIDWLPSFKSISDQPSGIVFKVKRHHLKTKETYVKMTGGLMKYRGMIGDDKVTKIAKFCQGKMEYVGELVPGDIAIVSGLHHLETGDVFGDQETVDQARITKATLQVTIQPVRLSERSKLLDALMVITEEDPYVSYVLNDMNDSITMQICGGVQLEIIKEDMWRRFGLQVEFSLPEPVYLERINDVSEMMIHMREGGLPFYAGIGLSIKPLPVMSGIKYVSDVSNGFLRQTYQNGIEDGILSHLSQGLNGWELVDMEIRLIDFEYDSVNGTPKEYRDLAPLVLFEAIKKVGTHLLWPLYDFTLMVSVEHLGRALRDISSMKGSYEEPIITESSVLLKGSIPVERCLNYQEEVRDYTSGEGVFHTQYGGYEIAPDGIQAKRENFKVDPSNRGEYLLARMGVKKG